MHQTSAACQFFLESMGPSFLFGVCACRDVCRQQSFNCAFRLLCAQCNKSQ